MPRFTPTDIVSQYSAIAALNGNFDTISTLIELCLFRDGTSPNQMLAALNMNNFKIQNLADGTASSDAVNVGQLQTAVLGSLANLSLSGTLTVADASTLAGVNATSLLVSGAASAGSLTVSGNTQTNVLTVTDSTAATGLVVEQVGTGNVAYKADTHSFRDKDNNIVLTVSEDVSGLNVPLGFGYSVDGIQVIREQGAALPAPASDLATAITLVNAIRNLLTSHHQLA